MGLSKLGDMLSELNYINKTTQEEIKSNVRMWERFFTFHFICILWLGVIIFSVCFFEEIFLIVYFPNTIYKQLFGRYFKLYQIIIFVQCMVSIYFGVNLVHFIASFTLSILGLLKIYSSFVSELFTTPPDSDKLVKQRLIFLMKNYVRLLE